MAQFYKCDVCNKIVAMVNEGAPETICCGQSMSELVPGTIDASREKHVPYVMVNGTELTVQIGSEKHPMTDKHRIEWVCLKTDRGVQLKYLAVGEDPVVKFYMDQKEKPVTVYAYCNLHGLWSADIQ